MEDEVNEQENEDSEQFESNENTKRPEEFNSEIQIPENIDINIDETPSDEIEVSDDTEASEKTEEDEQDFSEFDNFVPSSRFNSRATVNPFLEQEAIEPVENLERDLHRIPNRETEDNQTQVFNAPQYSSSGNYADKSYYEEPTDDTYPEPIRPIQTGLRSPIDISLPFADVPKVKFLDQRDIMAWRNQEDSGYPEGEQKYKFGSETRKRRRDDL